MRILILGVPVVAVTLAAIYACDGDNTAGARFGGGDAAGEADPNSGIATQPAPNTATQPAPNTATQPAPNTATQAAPNTATEPAPNTATQAGPGAVSPGGSSGGGTTEQQCAAVCSHIVSMECLTQAQCDSLCPAFAATGTCQAIAQALANCAMTATSCDALDGCETLSDQLDTCVSGSSSNPPPTVGGPTISDPANCRTSDQCGGCTVTCDMCVCAGQLAGATSAAIATGCADYC